MPEALAYIALDGVTGAAPIWYHGMLYAEHHLPNRPFPVPPGVRRVPSTAAGSTTTDWALNG